MVSLVGEYLIFVRINSSNSSGAGRLTVPVDGRLHRQIILDKHFDIVSFIGLNKRTGLLVIYEINLARDSVCRIVSWLVGEVRGVNDKERLTRRSNSAVNSEVVRAKGGMGKGRLEEQRQKREECLASRPHVEIAEGVWVANETCVSHW